MSNFLLKDPNCVFIHIPKTGGSSIRHGIWEGRYEGPVFGDVPGSWKGYFKFGFCRHPLDRLISAWADFTQHRRSQLTLEQFIDVVLDENVDYGVSRSSEAERIRHHTIPQTHPFNCLGAADVVCRYENYATDLAAVLSRLRIQPPARLPEIRKTQRGHWSDYLFGVQLDRSVAFYHDDFRELGYALP